MDEDISKKIDGIVSAIDLVQQKNETYKQNILASLHGLEEELDHATSLLEKNSGAHDSAQHLTDSLSENLLQKKPLTNIEQSNKKFYKYISKLGKRIEALKKLNDTYMNLYNTEFDKRALNEAIAHYVFSFAVENNQIPAEIDFPKLCSELGVTDVEDLVKKFEGLQDMKTIHAEILEGKIERLKDWVLFNSNKLTELQSSLPLIAYEQFIIDRLQKGSLDMKNAIDLARELFAEMYEVNKSEIDKFVTFLVLWDIAEASKLPAPATIAEEITIAPHQNFIIESSDPHYFNFHDQSILPASNFFDSHGQTDRDSNGKEPHRDFFTHNYSQYFKKDLESLATLFLKEAHKVLKISKSDSLFEVFRAGVITYPQFLQYSDILNAAVKEEDTAGVTLELSEEFNYHTQIVCPVSKEVCSKENPPVMLTCGHIISEISAKKLAQIRTDLSTAKKFKCPVCPEEQTYSKIRMIKLD